MAHEREKERRGERMTHEREKKREGGRERACMTHERG